MSERKIDKFKKHVKDHKEAYIVGGLGVVVTAAVTYLVVSGNEKTVNLINEFNGDFKDSPITNINQFIEIQMVRPGPKSFVIQCLETQKTWPSIRSAAEDLGVNPGKLGSHLKGKFPDVDGLTFTKVAEI